MMHECIAKDYRGKLVRFTFRSAARDVKSLCRAAHRMFHDRMGNTTYQLESIDGKALGHDLALICW